MKRIPLYGLDDKASKTSFRCASTTFFGTRGDVVGGFAVTRHDWNRRMCYRHRGIIQQRTRMSHAHIGLPKRYSLSWYLSCLSVSKFEGRSYPIGSHLRGHTWTLVRYNTNFCVSSRSHSALDCCSVKFSCDYMHEWGSRDDKER